MECNRGVRVPSAVRNCPQCGRLSHPEVHQDQTFFPERAHYGPNRRRKATLLILHGGAHPPQYATAMIVLQRPLKKLKVKGQPTQYVHDGNFFVLVGKDRYGKLRNLSQSDPLPPSSDGRETPESRAILDVFRERLVTDG